MASFISAVAWVPRGVAAQHPEKFTASDEEMARISQLAKLQLDEANDDLEALDAEDGEGEDEEEEEDGEDAQERDSNDPMDTEENGEGEEDEMQVEKKSNDPNDLSIYNLDDYDDEPSKSSGAFSKLNGLQHPDALENDQYVTLDDKDDDENIEREQLEIYPTDNLIITARTQDDVSQLEVYVYDQSTENLYVHHDLLLPSMPICLEWLPYKPYSSMEDTSSSKGNYVAVGTLEPDIEVWSLDVVEGIYPDAILGRGPQEGGEDSQESKKSSKKKNKSLKSNNNNNTYHTDAILSLSSNKTHPNLLASSSADCTIKLWDLSYTPSSTTDSTASSPLISSIPAIRSFSLHDKRKVQSIQWNPTEPTVLASGAYDGMVKVFDTRSPESAVGAHIGSVDIECVRWDPWSGGQHVWLSADDGRVLALDIRTLSSSSTTQNVKPIWTLHAHDDGVTAMDISSSVKGLAITGGSDKSVKVWNVNSPSEGNEKTNINLVVSRNLGVGKVFTASFCPNDPTTLAIAGSTGPLQLWDVSSNAGVRKAFHDALVDLGKDLSVDKGDGIIRTANEEDDEDVSDDDEQ